VPISEKDEAILLNNYFNEDKGGIDIVKLFIEAGVMDNKNHGKKNDIFSNKKNQDSNEIEKEYNKVEKENIKLSDENTMEFLNQILNRVEIHKSELDDLHNESLQIIHDSKTLLDNSNKIEKNQNKYSNSEFNIFESMNSEEETSKFNFLKDLKENVISKEEEIENNYLKSSESKDNKIETSSSPTLKNKKPIYIVGENSYYKNKTFHDSWEENEIRKKHLNISENDFYQSDDFSYLR
jgi:hypothetical protein